MKKIQVLLACISILSLTLTATAQAGEILVSAAASLSNAFTELKEIFEQQDPGSKVINNFAASNPLLKQIEIGAPVDVFASADQATMDKAAERKFIIEKSRLNFAANSLVLIVPAAGMNSLRKAAELTDKNYQRIALGNPDSVPAGRYAREALEQAGLWAKLEGKLIYGESVRQVLDYVARGEAQAGFVYSTDAKQAWSKIEVLETLQTKTPISYPIAVLERSKAPEEAQAFVDFVLSPVGQAILAKHGFSKP